ncbi:MAG: hypothetical protein GF365_05415 [Candidatus Buchananbacteria bacterium]|nr:hypothetical protein [Candidatus Buchananbacteria bacterium]
MKKIITIFILVIIFSLILVACNKSVDLTAQEKFNIAQTQVDNYFNYRINKNEYEKIARSENNDLYYYAANGKRYIFPNLAIFESWFDDYDINHFEIHDLQTLYQTPLGGNVTLRPGTLMMTETDPSIYLITDNGNMKVFENLELLEELYGFGYEDLIVPIPNFYFTNYKKTGTITKPEDFPKIPANLTIDQDKGFE